jgi:hypothetical protein
MNNHFCGQKKSISRRRAVGEDYNSQIIRRDTVKIAATNRGLLSHFDVIQ